MKRRLLILFWILLAAIPVLARVGGGQSYSGGGGSYSGGGSSSSGGDGQAIGFIIELIIRLVFYYPKIGIPLLIGGGLYLYFKFKSGEVDRQFNSLQNWSAQNTVERRAKPSLSSLKSQDPNFSETLFLDLVNSLYTRALTLYGKDMSELGAYLAPHLRESLEKGQGEAAEAVVIGAYRIISVQANGQRQSVKIEVESNLSLAGGSQLYVVDHLTFTREGGTKTSEPEIVYALSCPNCGNPGGTHKDGRCKACDQVVNDGRWSWVLITLSRHKSTPKSPVVLSSGGMELGTDLPTRRSHDLTARIDQLVASDPAFDTSKFRDFATDTFLRLQDAWTNMKWEQARPLETDFLFGQHQYWMNSYRRDGLRNVLSDVEVTRVELSRITIDRYFETITVRIFAKMIDYTIEQGSGKVVSGFPNQSRKFSEYWTFVRRAGVTSKDRDAATCPNCGAPLDKVTQVGECSYCQTEITRGDFDWILSRIEQDEAYFL